MRYTLTLVGFLAMVGCGDHPFDKFLDQGRALNETICECAFASSTEFCTSPDFPTDAETACARQVYDENEDQIQPNFSCVNAELREARRSVAS